MREAVVMVAGIVQVTDLGHSSGAHESYHSSSPHIYGGSHGMIGGCSSNHQRNEEEE